MVRLTEEEFMKKYNLYSQELMNISYGYTRNKVLIDIFYLASLCLFILFFLIAFFLILLP